MVYFYLVSCQRELDYIPLELDQWKSKWIIMDISSFSNGLRKWNVISNNETNKLVDHQVLQLNFSK